jgi:predicted transcriptional regulator
LYRLGEASVAEVLQAVPELPSYSAARSALRQLEEKGYARHLEKGLRYVYVPELPKEKARRSVLAELLETFFDGSPAKTMKALLDLSRSDRYQTDLETFEELIRKAREEGR